MRTRPTPPGENPAAAILHIDALPAGTMLGEFEVQSLLAVGGFGMVYQGYDHTLHRQVAIKEYMPSALVGRPAGLAVSARSQADEAPFQTGLKSFIDEARLLARFDHPSLVKVYRFWEANNTAYMAMPLYYGITLKEARRRMSGPPPEAWLRKVLWSVLQALQVLHDADTLHRDVSPDNIFLQEVGPPVLLDLGAARKAILGGSQKHTAILKVNYAPIEQYADAEDLREGPWTDLYALAAVLHGCICNEAPLPATFRVVRDRMPSFAQVALTARDHFGQVYSKPFVSAITHALAIEPSQRPQSVGVLATEMQLVAPEDLARFDWRAALGPDVRLESAVTLGANEVTAAQTTLPAPQPRTQVVARRNRNADMDVRRGSARKTRKRPRRTSPLWSGLWGAIAIALMALLVLGIYNTVARRSTVPSVQTAAESGQVLPVPIQRAANVEVAPPPQASASASQALARGAVTGAAGAVAARAKGAAPPQVAAHSSQGRTEKPAESTASSAAKPSAEQPSAAKGGSKPPALCADASVFERTMCVYKECQKPEYAQLPQCVADRKHWEARNKQILP
jgi:serine/threonine protein kinase